MTPQIIITAFICIGLGAVAGFLFKKYITDQEIDDARKLSERILDEAKKDAQAHKKEVLLQAQDEVFALKKEVEQDLRRLTHSYYRYQNKISRNVFLRI